MSFDGLCRPIWATRRRLAASSSTSAGQRRLARSIANVIARFEAYGKDGISAPSRDKKETACSRWPFAATLRITSGEIYDYVRFERRWYSRTIKLRIRIFEFSERRARERERERNRFTYYSNFGSPSRETSIADTILYFARSEFRQSSRSALIKAAKWASAGYKCYKRGGGKKGGSVRADNNAINISAPVRPAMPRITITERASGIKSASAAQTAERGRDCDLPNLWRVCRKSEQDRSA